ncbi:Pre-mRNA-splicing factor SYF2 [Strongyloides ratti]|uniref:Pre-mRNA-splicing factor SYF2 n=1 Tax=Strongyloides ratti TaxID=34506 RepID=A0A090KX97_STRRB|nr:Pre-mRNA-splicing factor SYF2 [Strongyloides ratti]CEF62120.1 Pre-mRNA-splicing factor SYF2 [Strongyloides ratti]
MSEAIEEPSTSNTELLSTKMAPKKVDISSFQERLEKLHAKRMEIEKKNMDAVVEEDRLKKQPIKDTMKRKREAKVVKKVEDEMVAEELGVDYDRYKSFTTSAIYADKMEEINKKKKKFADTGFSNYEDASMKAYVRAAEAIKPDFDSYNKMKEIIGEDNFYPKANTIIDGTYYPSEASLEKLSQSIDQREKKRREYHRRRTFDPDAVVDYINEKNRKYNQKLERYYGQYTKDIKDSLERGTAL